MTSHLKRKVKDKNIFKCNNNNKLWQPKCETFFEHQVKKYIYLFNFELMNSVMKKKQFFSYYQTFLIHKCDCDTITKVYIALENI